MFSQEPQPGQGNTNHKEERMGRNYPRILVCGLTLVMLLSLLAVPVGCGSSGGGGGEAAVMMEKLPKDSEVFMFMDFAAMRADDGLEELYDGDKEFIESEAWCGVLGISVEDVDRVACGSSNIHLGISSDNRVMILEGSFDLGEVKAELAGNSYEPDKYKEVETWENGSSSFGAVALVGDSCIVVGSTIGSARDCIDVIKGDSESLGDDTDSSRVMRRLPAGLEVSVGTVQTTRGNETTGDVLAKKDSSTVRKTTVSLFEDREVADDEMEWVKGQFEEYDNVKVKRDGRFITVTAEMDIESYLSYIA
jgi:hypothetical protein